MIQGSRTFLLILLILQTGCEKSDTPPETSTKVDTGAELSIEEQISWEYDHGKRLPRLFRNERFSASIVASAANRYIAMGEDSAIKELKGIAENEVLSKHDIKERIGWICRILYRGDSELLRRPGFGALSLPYLTMLDTDWPLYPVVYSVIHTLFSLGDTATLGDQKRQKNTLNIANKTVLSGPIPCLCQIHNPQERIWPS